jgi:hypothetical protein
MYRLAGHNPEPFTLQQSRVFQQSRPPLFTGIRQFRRVGQLDSTGEVPHDEFQTSLL